MKKLLLISLPILFACNSERQPETPVDSLGVRMTDTTGRNDTMYYERMQHKTGIADSSHDRPSRRDTAYYERMEQRALRDSGR